MFETITQTGAFLSILAAGLIFFVLTSLFSGGDDDGGHHDGEAHSSPSFLSMRNAFLLATGFGAGGAIGTHYGFGPMASSFVGLAVGLGFAALGWLFYRSVMRQQATTSHDSRRLVGTKAIVAEAIPPGRFGLIRASDEHGGTVYLSAGLTDQEASRPRGSTVEIIDCSGGIAFVR